MGGSISGGPVLMANGNKNAFSNFYTDMLEADPQMAFMGEVAATDFGGTGMTAPMQQRAREYTQGQYQNIYSDYMGDQAKQMRSGTDPSQLQSFTDYLEKNPFTNRYSALTPQQRGVSNRRFAPSTRFIFF